MMVNEQEMLLLPITWPGAMASDLMSTSSTDRRTFGEAAQALRASKRRMLFLARRSRRGYSIQISYTYIFTYTT
jgi:hypothetical protein